MQQNRIIISLSTLILFVGFLSCSNEDVVETDPELIPYFQIFAEEAAKFGFTVDYEAERIEGLIEDIRDRNIQGQCFHNEEKPKKVIIDINYWANADESEKQFIIFHELGHCFLDRDHRDASNADGTCVSIMHSSPQACSFTLTAANRESYLNELFTN